MIASPPIKVAQATQYLSRIAYCPLCAQRHWPKSDNMFILYGTTRRSFFVHKPDPDEKISNHRIGYTPHLFQLETSANGQVVYLSVCSAVGCGFEIGTDRKNKRTFKYRRAMTKGVMTTAEWNALVAFKRTGYEL